MAIFAVIARSDPAKMKAAIERQYGANHHEFASDVWFVPDVGTTKDVADKIGLTGGTVGSEGVVLGFTGYSGWGPPAGWQWLGARPDTVPNG